jgi:hypothetical protein
MLSHVENLGLKFKCDNFLYNRHKKVLKTDSKIDRVVYGGTQWWGSLLLNMAVRFFLNFLLYGFY